MDPCQNDLDKSLKDVAPLVLQYPSFGLDKVRLVDFLWDSGKSLSWSLKGMLGCSHSREFEAIGFLTKGS